MIEREAELLEAPPLDDKPTHYDWAHRICYLGLLDADADGAAWQDVARTVLKLDPDADPDRVKAIWSNHLGRARWMTTNGYRAYLAGET